MDNVLNWLKSIYNRLLKKKPQIHIDVNAVNSQITIVIHKD